MHHHDIVIVGAGAGGVGVANALLALEPDLDVAVVDPRAHVHYEPLRPVSAVGLAPATALRRSFADVLDPRAHHIQDVAIAIEPDVRRIALGGRPPIRYTFLVVATGRLTDWGAIRGLEDGPDDDVISVACECAMRRTSERYAEVAKARGRALFVSCERRRDTTTWSAGFLAHAAARKLRRGASTNDALGVAILTAAALDPHSRGEQSMVRSAMRRGITVATGYQLTAVDRAERVATFRDLQRDLTLTQPFDLLHVTPPTTAVGCLTESALIDRSGHVTVDPKTLQHRFYPTVFALGAASDLPCASGPQASATQASIVAGNIRACIHNTRMRCAYDGHTIEPVITGPGRGIVLESTYNGEVDGVFPFDQTIERRSLFDYALRGHPESFWRQIAPTR